MELMKILDRDQGQIINTLQEIVRIRSVEGEAKANMPFGEGVNEALEYALNLGEKMGFTTKNIDHYAGYIEFGDGSETIGILVHLDVVPEGNGWTYPPFAAEIHEGKIIGRGVMDNKCSFVTCLYAMKAIKESGLPLRRKIRMILGTNEETRWEGIQYYLTKESPPEFSIVPDANFPVLQGEKGILNLDLSIPMTTNQSNQSIIQSIKGGVALNSVPDQCQVILKKEVDTQRKIEDYLQQATTSIDVKENEKTLVLDIEGKSTHACTPESGHNAISQAMQLLNSICPADDSAREFINWYHNAIGMEFNGQSIGCGFEDELSGKLTFNVGIIKGDSKGVNLGIDIRYPITMQSKTVINGIEKALIGTKVSLNVTDEEDPIFFEEDHFLIKTLLEVYRQETGDTESTPTIIGGGTYARTMKNAVAFGPEFPGDPFVAHLKDEFVTLDNLKKIARIYTKAIYELAK